MIHNPIIVFFIFFVYSKKSAIFRKFLIIPLGLMKTTTKQSSFILPMVGKQMNGWLAYSLTLLLIFACIASSREKPQTASKAIMCRLTLPKMPKAWAQKHGMSQRPKNWRKHWQRLAKKNLHARLLSKLNHIGMDPALTCGGMLPRQKWRRSQRRSRHAKSTSITARNYNAIIIKLRFGRI